FHVSKSTAGVANTSGDVLRDANLRGVQIDVVGDERLSCSDHGRAGCWVDLRLTKIRLSIGVRGNLAAERFELSTSDVLEIGAFGSRRGSFVEIDGDLQSFRDFASGFLRDFDTVLERNASDWNKGNNVRCAKPWMLPLMLGKVDVLHGRFDTADRSVSNRFWRSHNRNDGAVVIAVHLAAQE